MPSFTSLALLALPFAAQSVLGAPNYHIGRRLAGVQSRAAGGFTLKKTYAGADFLEWDFFSDADPTHGTVNYLNKADAQAKNLAFVDTDGTFVMQVDNTTVLPVGTNRNSVRISSPTSDPINKNLVIADFVKMPVGMSTWPSYWSLGPDWPNNGEIDVVEGVNNAVTNQMTLHTTTGCTLDNSFASSFSGKSTGALDCTSPGADNTGCPIVDSSPASFGQDFNVQNGGVWAHLVDDTGIKIWRFNRGAIPADITAKNPDPTTWGTPAAFFSNTGCNVDQHFKDHSLVINVALCGDFAGAVFPGGKDACNVAVADPQNFLFATWRINAIDVYDPAA